MQKITGKKGIIIIVVVFIILLFILSKSCGNKNGNKYEFKKVSIGTVKETITESGVLEVLNPYIILSKTSGIITRIYVDFNQIVRRGQVLASMDSSVIDQKLMKFKTEFESAKLELLIAQEELEGKRNMFKDNLISKKAIQQAEFKYKSVLFKHKRIKIEYNHLKKQKSYTKIVSPVSGTIIIRNIKDNSPIGVNMPVFMVAPTLRKMTLVVSIDESEIGTVKKGLYVTFTVSAFTEKKFTGRINQVRINPINKGNIVKYLAIVECDNNELLLKPGMTATVTIIVNEKKDVLRVPNHSLIVRPIEIEYEKEKQFVWKKIDKLIDDLPVKRVEVNVGLKGDTHTEIVKNLIEGDEVLYKVIKSKSAGSNK